MAPEITPEQREEAYRILESVGSGPVRSYCTRYMGRELNFGCLSIIAHRAEFEVLPKIRSTFPRGLVAFIGDDFAPYRQPLPESKVEIAEGYSLPPQEVIVGAGSTQFDILRHAATVDTEGRHDTADIIRKLQEYDRLHGIRIDEATTWYVGFELLNKPVSLEIFERDLYTYNPAGFLEHDFFDRNKHVSLVFPSKEYKKRIGIKQS